MELTDDLAQRILMVAFAVILPIGIYHRLKARTDEALDRRQEGWLILVSLRPLGFLFMSGMMAFTIKPSWMAWASLDLPSWLRWCGVCLGVMTGGLMIWTFRCLGRNLTDTVVTRRDATLIVHGPYRWVRHPFYLCFCCGVIANSLTTANAFLAITGSVAFVAIVARTSIEERFLVERFGAEYERFMQETGRFLPRFGQKSQTKMGD
jgi:protein-S-isoprenylcysteine O-methyltransferase Ste14